MKIKQKKKEKEENKLYLIKCKEKYFIRLIKIRIKMVSYKFI